MSKKIINEFGSNGAQKQQNSKTANQQNSKTAKQQNSKTAKQQNSKTAKQQNQAQKTHNLFVRFCLNLADFGWFFNAIILNLVYFSVKFVLPAWNCLKFDTKNLTTRGKLNICIFKLQINQTRGQSNIRQNQPKQSKFKPIITKSIAKSSKKAVHRRKFGPG